MASQVQVFLDDGFKELPTPPWVREDLGAADFDLPDREMVAITGLPVFGRMGHRQAFNPFVNKGLNLFWPQLVADGLQLLRFLAGQETIIQNFTGDAGPTQLLFCPFVDVQIHLDGLGNIAAHLDEPWPEIDILQVEVVMVDGYRLSRPIETHLALFILLASLERFSPLLGYSNQYHAFLCTEFALST